MLLQLRPAVAADMAEIMRLERAGFAEAIQETEATFAERLSAAPEGCWVLAGEAGRLYGYLCAEFWPLQDGFEAGRFARDHAAAGSHVADGEEVYVSSMVVDPATRGTGWGRRLFRESLDGMFASHPRSARLTLLQVDLPDPPSREAALRQAQPHEVYNLAAQSFGPTSWN